MKKKRPQTTPCRCQTQCALFQGLRCTESAYTENPMAIMGYIFFVTTLKSSTDVYLSEKDYLWSRYLDTMNNLLHSLFHVAYNV